MTKNKSQNQDSILENLSQDSSNSSSNDMRDNLDNSDNLPPAYDIDQDDLSLLNQTEDLQETNNTTRETFISRFSRGSILLVSILVVVGSLSAIGLYFYPQTLSNFASYFANINVFSSAEHQDEPQETSEYGEISENSLQALLSRESEDPDIQALQTEIRMLIQRREELLARERQLEERITIIRARITETESNL